MARFSSLCDKMKKSLSKEMNENIIVPIHRNDSSNYDDDFASLKRRLAKEMKRVEEEMTALSLNLQNLTEMEKTQSCTSDQDQYDANSNWAMVNKSPLVEEDSGSKVMNLQFDFSQFEPSEVSARVCHNILYVSAVHEEESAGCVLHNEMKRQFPLPANTDVSSIRCTINNDGILLIKIPICQNTNQTSCYR